MKPSLKVGAVGTLSIDVGPGQTITLGDDRRATVFSTPSMINLMEHAARQALEPHLEAGEESVGIDVHVTHTSATPPRERVTAEAIVSAIEKNVISFDLVARDRWGEIGRGTHRRAIIDTSKFASRLADDKPAIPAAGRPTGLRTIDCHVSGPVLRLVLDRPQKRNAISAEMTGEMERLVEWLDQVDPEIRVVIVAGAAGSFCSGDDVGDLPDAVDAGRQLSLRRGELYSRMAELPQVLIAAVDGIAYGGGLVLAASCDYRIATHRARFGLPEVTLGWPPNYGMGIIQSLIGRGRALQLALDGGSIDARTAEAIGLADRLVTPAQLESVVGQLAQRFASLPPQAIAATKRLLSPRGKWSDLSASHEFASCLSTEAARRSITRFRS